MHKIIIPFLKESRQMISLGIKIAIVVCVFSLIPLGAQPQLPVASEDIIFEINFDNKDVTADISEGKSDVIVKLGKIRLEKSLWGNALYCGDGGAKLRYEIAHNIDFSKSGTVILWFCPLNWKKAKLTHPRIFFFGIENSKGFLGIQVANGPRNLDILERKIRILLLYFKHIPSAQVNINSITSKGDNSWHMLAVTWGRDEIGLSLNGTLWALKKINGEFKKEYFKGCSFSLGSNVGANYLLDMFRIYKRRLTGQELKDIYYKKLKRNN